MERLERNTTAVEEQVSRLRSHLLGAAAVLRDRSRIPLSGNHAKRLRRLAALIEAATPGLAILVGLPDHPSDRRDLDVIEASRNALCMACRLPRERHTTRGRCMTGKGRWSPVSAQLLLLENPKVEVRA